MRYADSNWLSMFFFFSLSSINGAVNGPELQWTHLCPWLSPFTVEEFESNKDFDPELRVWIRVQRAWEVDRFNFDYLFQSKFI